MSSKEKEIQRAEPPQREDNDLTAVITRHVMQALGIPAELQRVQVRRLWGDRYRVNVFVGKDIAATRIANSYFLTADKDGNIVEAMPTLPKR
jgi:hypothetical protein